MQSKPNFFEKFKFQKKKIIEKLADLFQIWHTNTEFFTLMFHEF